MKRFALVAALVAVSACSKAEEKPMATDTAKPMASMAMDSAAKADSMKKADSVKAAAAPMKMDAKAAATKTKTKSKM
jgi:hypothetical protein